MPGRIATELQRHIDRMRIKEGKRLDLGKHATSYTGSLLNKSTAVTVMAKDLERLARLQDILYADDRHSILIVLQAMDTAGKDGAIKHIMSGLNPQGVKVASFKHPSTMELDHDFVWRHYQQLPARGEIGIFNRSHYENVLISRVHPELVVAEHLPDISSVNDIKPSFWKRRYHVIRQFENMLCENGTIVIKFFLHLSKEEQKRRLIARIDDPNKNWKFSVADVQERGFWDDYQKAYEKAIEATSTERAPWYVIPADDKWFARLAMTTIVHHEFKRLNLQYPRVSAAVRKALMETRAALEAER